MIDLADARRNFLAGVEGYASGQAVRFTPALDDLIQWSEAKGLVYDPPTGSQALVRFRLPGDARVVWAATPRTGDGAKLTILAATTFPAKLRDEVRVELARMDGKPVNPDRPPEMAFTRLIWAPYRAATLELMARVLEQLTVTA